jgi:heme oxygenase (biliverdin-producing, ferredoxin)
MTMTTRRPNRAPLDTIDGNSMGFAQYLKARTQALHVAAERSGIIRELLRGRGTRKGYALLLSNLLPAYRELEHGLDRHINSRAVRALVWPTLYRAASIESDLIGLFGPQWLETLPLLPEGERYVRIIAAAADGDGARLIAHAYVRYLGDLSGGLIIKALLRKSLSLNDATLTYYDFPDIADAATFKAQFRDALDRAGTEIHNVAPVVDEAMGAFALNIALSEAVYAYEYGRPQIATN